MLLNDDQVEELHRKYAPNDKVYDLVYTHCKIVCEIAEWCADQSHEIINKPVLRNACLLHDIGTYILFDDNAQVANNRMYPQHTILGAKLLQDEGLDEPVWQAVETHILMGLTKGEIAGDKSERVWALPDRDYLPQTIEAELVCYADRFHSKHPNFNDYHTFLNRLKKNLPLQAEKLQAAAVRFGLPDLERLAKKYNQAIV